MKESVCEPVELRGMKDSVCECGEPGHMQESVCESGELGSVQGSVCESGKFGSMEESVCESGGSVPGLSLRALRALAVATIRHSCGPILVQCVTKLGQLCDPFGSSLGPLWRVTLSMLREESRKPVVA